MEDRRLWGDVERTIDETLAEIGKQRLKDSMGGVFRCGFSTPKQIADALRAKGLVKENE